MQGLVRADGPSGHPCEQTLSGDMQGEDKAGLAALINPLRCPAKGTCTRQCPGNAGGGAALGAVSAPGCSCRTRAASNLLQQTSQAGPGDISLRKIPLFTPLQRWREVERARLADKSPLSFAQPVPALLCLQHLLPCSGSQHRQTALFEEEKGMKKSPGLV